MLACVLGLAQLLGPLRKNLLLPLVKHLMYTQSKASSLVPSFARSQVLTPNYFSSTVDSVSAVGAGNDVSVGK